MEGKEKICKNCEHMYFYDYFHCGNSKFWEVIDSHDILRTDKPIEDFIEPDFGCIFWKESKEEFID
jgi:hypothetical protein